MGIHALPAHPAAVRATDRQGVLRRRKQGGVVAILFAVLLIVVFGFLGLALDMAQVFNRKVELQGVADSAALAAASSLSGTAEGIDSALALANTTASTYKYRYDKVAIPWKSGALTFSANGHDNWVDASAARSAPEGLVFAKVDTGTMEDIGTVKTMFMRVVKPALEDTLTSATAVAGRSTIKVLPLAICAMSNDIATKFGVNEELVQYGFRRGVSYNLLDLSPLPNGPAQNFIISAMDPPGTTSSGNNTSAAVAAPFVCTGTMPMTSVLGGPITVRSPFPIASLFQELNSRFDQFTGSTCNPNTAPPDFNIKSYLHNTNVGWMQIPPITQTALKTNLGNKTQTVADLDPALPGTPATATNQGPLWSFARAVPFSAYVENMPEPKQGYAGFNANKWDTLYAGAPAPKSYPSSLTPYGASGGQNFQGPGAANARGLRLRRVLNVPLLRCPVGGGGDVPATVLAIGRFFMTVPATATSISAEFGGLASESNLGGSVELYP